MSRIKRHIRRLIPVRVTEAVLRLAEALDPFARISFSQEGEDIVVRRLFEGQASGFYVDVGAHHPWRFSNTFHFYRRGWRGINIDADPAAIDLFRRARPRDVNLCVGVADRTASMVFHVFDEPALNTFDAALATERERDTSYKVVERRQVQVRPLADILAESMPTRRIDLMSVDAENFDLHVLRSNDWARFRPRCLLVEARETDISRLPNHPVHVFVASKEYSLLAKTISTLIYQDVAT
ncbi:MAG: FkbM family methyltransferase [Hyphomonadaceae bacterium]|nr:FkbM family methyltransferase [Hyphomonadaceae bacterium]